MSILWHPEFVCDGCGKCGDGRAKPTDSYNVPSVHDAKPRGWLRTYGYDLCEDCSREITIQREVNRLFNSAIHATLNSHDKDQHSAVYRKLWDNCRLKTYGPLHPKIQALRKRHGLPPLPHVERMCALIAESAKKVNG